MAFQSTVRQFQTTGLAGELAREGPSRAEPWILNSGADNPIGFFYTKESDGNVEVGGTGALIGILGRPKEHALVGTGASSLTPSNNLADGIVGSLFGMGILYVNLTSAANVVGDVVTMAEADGSLSTTAVGAGFRAVGRLVIDDIPDADGLAIIELTSFAALS